MGKYESRRPKQSKAISVYLIILIYDLGMEWNRIVWVPMELSVVLASFETLVQNHHISRSGPQYILLKYILLLLQNDFHHLVQILVSYMHLTPITDLFVSFQLLGYQSF